MEEYINKDRLIKIIGTMPLYEQDAIIELIEDIEGDIIYMGEEGYSFPDVEIDDQRKFSNRVRIALNLEP